MDRANQGDCGCTDGCRALSDCRRGDCGVVRSIDVDPRQSAALQAMGLRANSRVRVCRLGEPCIVEVVGRGGMSRRIGLARGIASRVVVGPAEPTA